MIRALLISLLLSSCALKGNADPELYAGMLVTTAVVQHPMDQREVAAAPEALAKGVADTLATWGAAPQPADVSAYIEPFSKRRTTAHRVAWLIEQSEADLVVLVETEARFFSQLQGRFRWVVDVTVAVAEVDRPEEAVEATFSVPVFLQFQHQREVEAVAAATGVVTRRLSSLLDDFSGRMPVSQP